MKSSKETGPQTKKQVAYEYSPTFLWDVYQLALIEVQYAEAEHAKTLKRVQRAGTGLATARRKWEEWRNTATPQELQRVFSGNQPTETTENEEKEL